MVRSGLVGHWPLHEWSGRANDLSGNGNHGTLNGGVTQGVAGKSGLTAYSFDGSDDEIETSTQLINGRSSLTICGWVRPKSFSDSVYIYSKAGQSQDDTLQVRLDREGVSIYLDDGTNTVNTTGNGTASVDEWQFVCLTYDGDLTSAYLNSELVVTDSSISGPLQSTSGQETIGSTKYNIYSNSYFADIRVYNRALSPSEIQTLYKQGSADVATPPNGSDSGAVSRWSFDDRSDTGTAKDEWGSNNGTVNGAVYSGDSVRGLSIDQDTNGDYIDTGFQSVSTPLTVSIWANVDSDDDSLHPMFGNYNGTSDDFGIRVDMRGSQNGHEAFFDNGPSINVSGTASIGSYDHIVYAVDSTESKLYKNGAVVGSAGGASLTVDNSYNFRIGGDHQSRSFIGQLDDIRYYDRKLSDYEVQQLYLWGTRGIDRRFEVLRH